ncbi:MAG: Y-family DNA polymerase [Chitinophagaceae bacterium]|nr:MAG: Y-family DNA polymerase [Chitinophagaceae bacterium]
MIALVDVNNFYAACERMFDPSLNGRPVIVLSNNDGCAIARSEEAKRLGIHMGTPVFMVQELAKEKDIAIFSSNYTLYGSMSARIMTILKSYAPAVEVYSIDEAFLDLKGLNYADLFELGKEIREKIFCHTGLAVSIGLAPTKALAKLANRYAKKYHPSTGVYLAQSKESMSGLLHKTAVGDIWGIGAQYQKLLLQYHVQTAHDLVNLPEEWVRKNLTVMGQRLVFELKGINAFKWEELPPPKQNICMSRSFGRLLNNIREIKQAIASHTAACARKLRSDKSCAKKIHVFIQTNPHKGEDKQFFTGVTIPLTVATSSSHELVKYAIHALGMIYRPGYNYMKAGVMVLDIVAETEIQLGLFDTRDRRKEMTIMKTLDETNKAFGDSMVRYGTHGYGDRWKLKADRVSPRYTTRIADIMKVKS